MATVKTKHGGRSVPHFHVGRDLNAAQRKEYRDYLRGLFPQLEEIRPPSLKYNCHGYSFARSHAVFEEPESFIQDDYVRVPMNQARRGDVLLYEKHPGEISHSAIVKTVANGKIKTLRSKWGYLAAVVHKPKEVHRAYGRPKRLYRKI